MDPLPNWLEKKQVCLGVYNWLFRGKKTGCLGYSHLTNSMVQWKNARNRWKVTILLEIHPFFRLNHGAEREERAGMWMKGIQKIGGRMDSGEICNICSLNGRRQGCFQPILGAKYKISVKWTHFQPKGIFFKWIIPSDGDSRKPLEFSKDFWTNGMVYLLKIQWVVEPLQHWVHPVDVNLRFGEKLSTELLF